MSYAESKLKFQNQHNKILTACYHKDNLHQLTHNLTKHKFVSTTERRPKHVHSRTQSGSWGKIPCLLINIGNCLLFLWSLWLQLEQHKQYSHLSWRVYRCSASMYGWNDFKLTNKVLPYLPNRYVLRNIWFVKSHPSDREISTRNLEFGLNV